MAKKPSFTDEEIPGSAGDGFRTRPAGGTPQPDPGGFATRPADTPPPLPGESDPGGFATRPAAPDPDGFATRPAAPQAEPEPEAPAQIPAETGRDAHGHARPATRIHGYSGDKAMAEGDDAAMMSAKDAPAARPVTGWLVVVEGPGRGAAVSLSVGLNSVGRGEDNSAQVDFGDDTISRDAHAYVSYDDERREFHISHSGKTNLVRLNDAPVLQSQELSHGDQIRIGATTLGFVALCGPHFDWSES
ncbi:FHA domain-containing protein [Rhodobacterales bacterium HKCCE2091]|nr:FHA domain-containing protein [Rhodobacterales bacterium HKCCE2091]